MPKVIHRWVVCLLLLLLIQISANAPKYQPLFSQDHYLLEAILQVQAVDFDMDHHAELLLAGKNYLGRELYVYCLGFSDAGKPLVEWRSANLFEEGSILWITVGNFSGTGQQLLVVTKRQYYFYDFDQNGFRLVNKLNSDCEPLAVAAADLDGDAVTELILVKAGGITNNAYDCLVEIRKMTAGKFIGVYQSGLLGNIRAITAGDVDRDQKAELAVEEGLRLDTGKIHFYRFKNGQLSEIGKLRPVNTGAIYATKVREYVDGGNFITGSTKGKINVFKWDNGILTPTASEFTVKSSLVDLETADINGDNRPELITIGYPAKLTVWGLR